MSRFDVNLPSGYCRLMFLVLPLLSPVVPFVAQEGRASGCQASSSGGKGCN